MKVFKLLFIKTVLINFRTKQTEEEVLRLEKIKKELQVLDGQFTQDIAVLRKKIDHACLSYSESEYVF